MSNDACGFVQANHRSRPDDESPFARDLGVGIDIHWKWYQPLRNRYGFVMFLGHGALLRRSCWQGSRWLPEIVSEDLGYAIALRERGYYGRFVEDVVCQEEFPATVRAFRIRHVKWTRGTCEFLHQWMARLVRAKNITTTENSTSCFQHSICRSRSFLPVHDQRRADPTDGAWSCAGSNDRYFRSGVCGSHNGATNWSRAHGRFGLFRHHHDDDCRAGAVLHPESRFAAA
ncbi:MAG: glycosyltransferase [Caulobacteraceae bacterium]|nr:glycosyltransferase [Caulobacteraceae bacterium]